MKTTRDVPAERAAEKKIRDFIYQESTLFGKPYVATFPSGRREKRMAFALQCACKEATFRITTKQLRGEESFECPACKTRLAMDLRGKLKDAATDERRRPDSGAGPDERQESTRT